MISRFTNPVLPNHPGRAALISGPKRQPISQNIPINNRSIALNSTSASSPSFSNVEHIRSYSLSRTYSDQSSPMTSRRTSISDTNEKSRRSSSQMIRAPKSLREWHEQPVNLLEQPSLLEKVTVQILSPKTHPPPFFSANDLHEKSKSEEDLNIDNENDNRTIHTSDVNENK